MKKILMATVFAIFFVIIGFIIFFRDTNEGSEYKSKETLCIQFAQSYLKTIPKVEADYNEEKQKMAIDVETDLYNMCLLDLNTEALGKYKPSALEKYIK